jgi:tetratricopeptide (TPR) repeat protein
MNALLDVLARDPARAHRRWWISGLAAIAVAGAGYGAATYRDTQARLCSHTADELADVWTDEHRDALAAAIHAAAVPYADATITAADATLDAYRARWITSRTAACEAHRLGHISDTMFDRRMLCLRQRRAQLAATVDVMTQTSPDTVAQLVDTAAGLPTIAACDDDTLLLSDLPPPADPALAAAVEQARDRLALLQARERAGRYADAHADLPALQHTAELLAHPPLLAEVHLLAGKLAMMLMRFDDALPHLERAESLGLATRADAVAAEALAIWIFVAGYGQDRLRDALAAAPRAEALLARVGAPPVLNALLHNNLATLYGLQHDPARSIAAYEAALALLVQHAPDDPLRPAIVHNLASTWLDDGQPARASQVAQAELARTIATYGACHPTTANLRLMFAHIERRLDHRDAALAEAGQALACLTDRLPAHALRALHFLVVTALAYDDRDAARRLLTRATAVLADHRDPQTAASFEFLRALLVARDQPDEARRLLTDLITHRDTLGPPTRIEVTAHLARLTLAADPTHALELAEQADALLTANNPPELRALTRDTLARALHALARDPPRVLALTDEALQIYTAAGPLFARDAADTRTWRATLPATP